MAVLEARIFASVYGTAAELAASPIVLGRGERWYRTDAPIVSDTTSPYFGMKNPAFQWKTGDGTKTWSQITLYDPIGTGTGGGGAVPDLNTMSVLANPDEDAEGPGQSIRIKLQPGDPEDTVTLKDLLGAMDAGDYSNILNYIGTLSEEETNTGGLRGVFDRFKAITSNGSVTINGTITSGSDTVVLASPLSSKIDAWARVFVNAGGTGIASPAYINYVNPDRMSFKLTSSMFHLSGPGAGTQLLATASGTRSLTLVDPNASVFGMSLDGIFRQNVFNGAYQWRSTPNALGSNTLTGEQTELRVKDGVVFHRAAQVQAGAWEQLTDAQDLVLMSRQIVAAVGPSSHHTWTNLPATATEFMGETNGRHRFRLMIPDGNYTQLMLGLDLLLVAGTNTSTMWVEWFDPGDSTWKDITTARVTVSLNTPIDASKESALGTLTGPVKLSAALSNSRSVLCRVMGMTTGAATGAPAFTNVWTIVK